MKQQIIGKVVMKCGSPRLWTGLWTGLSKEKVFVLVVADY